MLIGLRSSRAIIGRKITLISRRCKALPGYPVTELSVLLTAVMQEMQKFGAITLIRVPEGMMHFTFQDSVSAIHALQLDETEVIQCENSFPSAH